MLAIWRSLVELSYFLRRSALKSNNALYSVDQCSSNSQEDRIRWKIAANDRHNPQTPIKLSRLALKIHLYILLAHPLTAIRLKASAVAAQGLPARAAQPNRAPPRNDQANRRHIPRLDRLYSHYVLCAKPYPQEMILMSSCWIIARLFMLHHCSTCCRGIYSRASGDLSAGLLLCPFSDLKRRISKCRSAACSLWTIFVSG